MAVDKTKLLEHAQRQLTTRSAALQATLDEIEFLEKNKDHFKTPEQIVSWGHAVGDAKVRRDRQHNACKASQALIATLERLK